MREKKTYIVLIVVLVVFFLVMFVAFGIQNIKEGNQENILIIGNSSVFSHSDRKWYNVTDYSTNSKTNWQKYNVFLDNKSVGTYSLWHDDKWYAFDDKKNAVLLDGRLFAYKANYNIDVYDYNSEVVDRNDPYVQKVLEENGIDSSSEFSSSSKISFDFDNDGVIEDFYLITNKFPLDFTPDFDFSLAFMVKNDTIYKIYRDVISSSNYYEGCKPYFNTFLDVNSDKQYELILSCGKYSVSGQIDMLYKFSDGEFKILISNQ